LTSNIITFIIIHIKASQIY